MDEKDAYASAIAAEAVGETRGSPPPDPGERAVRPIATSAGSQARVADKTAESVGERTGDAYADATADEARERSRKAVRQDATQDRSRTADPVISDRFRQQTFTVIAAFALGYVAAVLIHRGM